MNRITAVIGMLLVSLGVGWLLFLGPALSNLRGVEAEQTQLRSRIAAASQVSNQLERMRHDYARQRRAYQRRASRLPDSPQRARLLQVITANTQYPGLHLHTLRPGPISTSTFYQSQSIEVIVQGDWQKLSTFVERINSQTRLVSLEHLQWQPINGEQSDYRQQIQLTLRAYWHHQADDALAPPERVNRPPKPPQSAANSTELSIQANPFAARYEQTSPGLGKGIVYQGRIRVDGTVWALLRRPNGKVIRLQSGEHLPSGKGQIGRIDPERIIVEPILGE